MTTTSAPAYIGIEEENDAEGETFGYYVSDTPPNRHALERLDVVFKRNARKFGSTFAVVLHPFNKPELDAIEYGARNNYMHRVQFIAEPVDWSRIMCAVENDPNALYKGGLLPLKRHQRAAAVR